MTCVNFGSLLHILVVSIPIYEMFGKLRSIEGNPRSLSQICMPVL